jgi:hypothetical protein
MCAEMGLVGETASSGRRLYDLAAGDPDVQCLLISDALDGPGIETLIQMLRRDPYTADLPIGLMSRAETIGRAMRIAEGDPLTVAFPRPHDLAGLSGEIVELLDLSPLDRPTPLERLRRASAALDHLATLAAGIQENGFYDILGQQETVANVLNTSMLSAKAARVLGLIGSPRAQTALVDFASQYGRPLAARQAAAAACSEAFRRRGVQLTRSQILEQYERYNQSEKLDRPTQELLGAILDSMEAAATPLEGPSARADRGT